MCERRRVVDAVAYHRHDGGGFGAFGRRLQLLDGSGFAFGQHLRQHPLDARLLGDGFGGLTIVAGEHDHFQPQAFQIGNGLNGAVFQGVCHGNDAAHPTIHSDQHGSFRLCLQAFYL
ncbi:MAG: hypothetical protein BWY25_00412 [Chloroflexi bacterium ADurb.Bin222]|nr:MAG: hypothetical protein BWY25_00412 [Chloroflexi bacterium ADurb.Bin222]